MCGMDWELFERFGIKAIGAIIGLLFMGWLFTAGRHLVWRELSDYGYSDVNHWHIFVAGPMKIRVSALMAGHEEFFAFVERKFRELGIIADESG